MNKALLLIDIQRDYFPGGNCPLVEPEQALGNALQALQYFRQRGWPVIHVQHINIRNGATFFLPGTSGAEIHELLKPEPQEDLVMKHTPNSFYQTRLLEILQEKRISEVVICGMMIHMCIDTTVRSAKDYGIAVSIIKEACATKDLCFEGNSLPARQVKNVFFASLQPMFANIISIEELIHF